MHLAELAETEHLLRALPDTARVETICNVEVEGRSLPVHAIHIGALHDPDAPRLAYIGGVHGLESIGTKILLAHLGTLVSGLRWDEHLRDLLRRIRLLFVPMLNPAGVLLHRRSNANGVDLMRNAPVEAEESGSPFWLFRGHRLAPWLPWFRGSDGQMEAESAALCALAERELFDAPFAMVLDVHSGFWGQDRIWFPYARSRRPFPDAPEVLALKVLLDETYPNHRYVVEPQSVRYTTHGDLWDYLYDRHRELGGRGLFLPLTLELGASAWLKKNPRQALTRRGFFHPVKHHRVTRLLRRHASLLELLMRCTYAHANWLPKDPVDRARLVAQAGSLWGF